MIRIKNLYLYLLLLTFIDVVLRYSLQLLVCCLCLGHIFIIPCYKELGVAYGEVLFYCISRSARIVPYTARIVSGHHTL
jgi:hypothetical protein